MITLAEIKTKLGYVGKKNFAKARVDFGLENATVKQVNDKIREVYNNALNNITKEQVKDDTIITFIRNFAKRNQGKELRLIYEPGGLDVDFISPLTGFDRWWKEFYQHHLQYNSDATIFNHAGYIGNIVLLETEKVQISDEVLKQYFLDGITHCVFTPIKNWAQWCHSKAVSKSCQKKYNTILNKIIRLESNYHEGVPQDKIQEICNDLQIDISVELPYCKDKLLECKSDRKRLKKFIFINTRMNHVDIGDLVNRDNVVLSLDQLKLKKKELDNSGEFYIYKKYNNLTSISTLDNTYCLASDYKDTLTEFEYNTGLDGCYIDDIKEPMLSSFVREGLHYNGTIDLKDPCNYITNKITTEYDELDGSYIEKITKSDISSVVGHIDRKKSYYNILLNNYFLGKITDFRQTNKIESVGMYQIINFKSNNIIINKFGYSDGIYPSPELEYLKELGCSFDIIAGAWGTALTFKEEDTLRMLQKTNEGVPYYCKWAGCSTIKSEYTSFNMKCNETEYANIIKKQFDDVIFYKGTNEIRVSYKKTTNKHLSHVIGFITSYERISVIKQLLQMKLDNIIRVCVDGIYYEKHPYNIMDGFVVKEDKTFNNLSSDYYIIMEPSKKYDLPEYKKNYQIELHSGVGGGGKTHINLTDKGLVKTLYICPSHKLRRDKMLAYDCNGNVLYNVLSSDPNIWGPIHRNYNALIFDEISQMSKEELNIIFNRYTNHKLIFCGDIGYQLSCVQGTPIQESDIIINSGLCKTYRYEKNHRVKCELLEKILQQNRKLILENHPTNYINNVILSKLRSRKISKTALKSKYKVEDLILSTTHKIKDEYNEMFGDLEKYIVKGKGCGYYKGDIIYEKLTGVPSEKQHAFTVHSIQGETATSNLYIDTHKMFSPQMLYTALSRARYLDQIYIIVD